MGDGRIGLEQVVRELDIACEKFEQAGKQFAGSLNIDTLNREGKEIIQALRRDILMQLCADRGEAEIWAEMNEGYDRAPDPDSPEFEEWALEKHELGVAEHPLAHQVQVHWEDRTVYYPEEMNPFQVVHQVRKLAAFETAAEVPITPIPHERLQAFEKAEGKRREGWNVYEFADGWKAQVRFIPIGGGRHG